jgi:hypothetical protein
MITLGANTSQLGDHRNDGESNFNSGDGTGQMAQTWMFMMKIMTFIIMFNLTVGL